MLPQLGGDVRVRAAAPDLALARIQLDEQRPEQLTSAERIGLVPRAEKTGEPHPRRRRRRIDLGLLCEERIALLPVLVGRNVAPLEALTHASQLPIDALPRSPRRIGRGMSSRGDRARAPRRPSIRRGLLGGQAGERYPWAYTITGAQTPSTGGHVTKKHLVTNALVQLNRGRVHIPADIPFADVLKQELAGYSRRVTASGVSIFENGSRDSPHDDLVFSLMLGIYAKSGLPERCRVYRRESATPA